jgi:hypothetical protein
MAAAYAAAKDGPLFSGLPLVGYGLMLPLLVNPASSPAHACSWLASADKLCPRNRLLLSASAAGEPVPVPAVRPEAACRTAGLSRL